VEEPVNRQFGVLQVGPVCWIVVTDDQLNARQIAACADEPTARRVAHLLSLYGLAPQPIPDTLEDLP
jgi:hypothetical protein